MVKHNENETEFNFELWGGDHNYNKVTRTYKIDRPYGIFSNMTVSTYGIFLLEKNGYEVDNFEFILNEYIPGQDIYSELFKINRKSIDWVKFQESELSHFEQRCFPTSFGLTWNIQDLNLNVTNEIIQKFFQPNDDVISIYDKVLYEKNIDLNNTLFIWARKTDKINETRIPEVSEYLKVIQENNLSNKKVILQTDDITVFDEFKKQGLNFDYLELIPFSTDGGAFHGRLDMERDELFKEKYGITKLQYIKLMFVTSLFCKNSHSCIIYPGNPTTYIPMIRNSFENCFLFKNNESYMKF
jgi:hypothetical protein